MDISWLAEPQTWVGLVTLLILEVVLGIDNLVFVAILAGKAARTAGRHQPFPSGRPA